MDIKQWTDNLLIGFNEDKNKARKHIIFILEHNDFSNNTAGLKLNQAILYELNLRK